MMCLEGLMQVAEEKERLGNDPKTDRKGSEEADATNESREEQKLSPNLVTQQKFRLGLRIFL